MEINRKIGNGMIFGFNDETKENLIYERDCLLSLIQQSRAWLAWNNLFNTFYCPVCGEYTEEDCDYPNDLICRGCLRVYDKFSHELIEIPKVI